MVMASTPLAADEVKPDEDGADLSNVCLPVRNAPL
jgi:hypothetical protein